MDLLKFNGALEIFSLFTYIYLTGRFQGVLCMLTIPFVNITMRLTRFDISAALKTIFPTVTTHDSGEWLHQLEIELKFSQLFTFFMCINGATWYQCLRLVWLWELASTKLQLFRLLAMPYYRWVARCAHCWRNIRHNWKKKVERAQCTGMKEVTHSMVNMHRTCHQLQLSTAVTRCRKKEWLKRLRYTRMHEESGSGNEIKANTASEIAPTHENMELNMPILWTNYVKKSRPHEMRKLWNVHNQQ